MPFTSIAQLDAAKKVALHLHSGSLATSSSIVGYFLSGITTPLLPDATIPTPAAIGAGGTLFANGDPGFIQFPQAAGALTDVSVTSGLAYTSTNSHVALYDVVWGASGIVANTTSPQAITGFPTLSRPDVNGTGLELILANIASSGSTSTTVAVDYTNSAGVSGRTASLILQSGSTTSLASTGFVFPLKLQDGDDGVQSVQGITFGTAQASPGGLWLMLGRRLTQFPIAPAENMERFDAIKLTLPDVSNAALALMGILSGSNVTTVNMALSFAME